MELITSHIESFQSKYPIDKNSIKQVHKLLNDEVGCLEIYSPPILINDYINNMRRFVKYWKLDLEVIKGGSDWIMVKEKRKIINSKDLIVNY